jgi:RNA-dependent RNA polymerase
LHFSLQIIGILYRKIKQPTYPPKVPITFDEDLVVEGHDEYLEDALVTKKDYNFRIIALMNQFGVKTEAELVSGCVVKLGKAFLKNKPYEHIQRMCQAVYALKKEYLSSPPLPPLPQTNFISYLTF